MDFRPYPKISFRSPDAKMPGGLWVATEKVHGAHLVVATDGRSVRVGKRKEWLADATPFFGWQLLRTDLAAAARAAYAGIAAMVGAAESATRVVRLYGELFGGGYPHAGVPTIRGASPVQTGIWYAPDVRFVLFDVLVEDMDADEGTFLAHHEVETLQASGIVVVPRIGRGARADLDALPVRFATRVPPVLGLPPIANNFAEGLVIKPDARAKPSERAVIKRKIPEFDEARFDESAPSHSDVQLDVQALSVLAGRLVNPPRVASARSKQGNGSVEALVTEIVLDVLVDLEAAFPRAMRELGEADEDNLRTLLADAAKSAVARY